jgi:large subunit ribosomal protein L21
MYAVILTGGKQYRVKEGETLDVEKLEAPAGSRLDIEQVLLVEDGADVLIGTPYVENAMVRAEVLETFKDDKVLIFKKKRTKQYRRTKGHRQLLTRIRVEGIYADKSKAPAVGPARVEEAPAPKPVEAQAPPAAAPAPKPAAKRPAPAAKPARAAVPRAVKPVKRASAKKAAAKKSAPAKKTKKRGE